MRDKLGETLRRRLWEQHHSDEPESARDPEAADEVVRPLSSRLAQWIGGLVSLSLVIGVVFWVFELGRRDANEVPVVKAMAGLARETPEDSRGPIVENQGLQVNQVLGSDETAPIEAETRLAPPPQRLTPADTAIPPAALPEAPIVITPQPSQSETAFVLPPSLPDADPNMTRAVRRAPSEALSPTAQLLSNAIADAVSEVANEAAADAQEATPAPPAPPPVTTPPATPATGQIMVQLGAGSYYNEEAAIREWDAALADNQDLMGDLSRFIDRREAGGRVFYRLRAPGFNSMVEASALCDALLARGVACIAVPPR